MENGVCKIYMYEWHITSGTRSNRNSAQLEGIQYCFKRRCKKAHQQTHPLFLSLSPTSSSPRYFCLCFPYDLYHDDDDDGDWVPLWFCEKAMMKIMLMVFPSSSFSTEFILLKRPCHFSFKHSVLLRQMIHKMSKKRSITSSMHWKYIHTSTNKKI